MKKIPLLFGIIIITLGLGAYTPPRDPVIGYVKACQINVKANKLEIKSLLDSNRTLEISDLIAGNTLMVESGGIPVYEKPDQPPDNRVIIPGGTKIKVLSDQPLYIAVPAYENWEWIWVKVETQP